MASVPAPAPIPTASPTVVPADPTATTTGRVAALLHPAPPCVHVTVEGHRHVALVDTGASRSCIAAAALPHHARSGAPSPIALTAADTAPLANRGTTRLSMSMGNVSIAWDLVILERAAYDVIIGADLLAHLAASVHLRDRHLLLSDGGSVPFVGDDPASATLPPTSASLALVADPEDALTQPDAPPPTDAALDAAVSSTLPTADRAPLVRLLHEHRDCFARDPKRPGTTLAVTHAIPTGDAAPIASRAYRVGPFEVARQREEVDRLLADGLIRPSTSPWASPVVMADKKDGSKRFCCDYRKLNSVTVPDRYPLPRIDDLLDRLGGACIFSTLDLASGYWQVRVRDEDIIKTAFRTAFGLYEWLVMPFGLTNAPATFQRLMDATLRDLIGPFVLVYLDDVIVFSRSIDEHVSHLRAVFDRLHAANLHLKLSKCSFGQRSVAFLGHVASATGLLPDPAKLKAVADMPAPTDLDGVRAFLGLCSYYRRFVPKFAELAEPLHRLLRKGVTFAWDPACATAFTTLKQLLVSPPVLAFPNPNVPYVLHTDASAFALGAVLVQNEHPVAYASRTLSSSERNYSATERECLAVVWAIKEYRHLLLGRPFSVVTDHAALQWLRTAREPAGRLARWVLELQPYTFTIAHRPGAQHRDADALSRLPVVATLTASTESSDADAPDADNVVADFVPADTEPPSDAPAAAVPALLDLDRAVRADPTWTPWIDWLEGRNPKPPAPPPGAPTLHDHLALLEGRLCYVDHKASSTTTPRLVVPASMHDELLRAYHATPAAGHLGIAKTLHRLRDRFFWIGLSRDVHLYVAACDLCQRHKSPRRPTLGHLQPLPIDEPWHTVHLDTFGPLPVSDAGNAFIMVFTDHFTRWPEAFAVASNDAATAARLFVDQIIARYGAPARLLTDRGTNFMADLMALTCRALGVDRSMTTAYHPQTDGLVERFNHTMAALLSMFVADHQRDWDTHLDLALYAYRTAHHPSIGTSPYELLFGVRPRMPVDVTLDLARAHTVDAARTDAAAYVRDLFDRLSGAHAAANTALRAERDRQARHHDLRAGVVPPYDTGSLVWLQVPTRARGLSPKLRHPWTGPFVITEVLSPTVVRISTPGRRATSDIVNVNRLKPYISPWQPPTLLDPRTPPAPTLATTPPASLSPSSPPDSSPPPATATPTSPSAAPVLPSAAAPDDNRLPDGYYTVDKILDHRPRGRGTQYLILWTAGDTTWEPAKNLHRDLIRDYHATQATPGPRLEVESSPRAEVM